MSIHTPRIAQSPSINHPVLQVRIDSQIYVNTHTTNPTETQTIHSLIIDSHVSVNVRTINVVLIAAEVAKELQQRGLTAEYALSADCHLSVKRRTINH